VPLRAPDRRFAAWVVLGYLPVALFAITHHEMWRDELHCWLVARDSPFPWDVVHNRAYDGQPPLWYLLLWVLQKLTHAVVAMQIAHVAIAVAVVWVFASRAPFPRVVRALFPFGYFPAYEYVALSRCYGLALLFVLLLCDQREHRFARPWCTGLLLAALALTTTVATVVATAYTATLLLDAWSLWRRRDPLAKRAAVPIGLAALGVVAAGLCAWPPADSTVTHVGWPHAWPDDTALTRIVVALVPVPHVDFFFWNSNALMWWEPFRAIAAWVALAAAAWIVVVLSRDRTSAVLYAVGTFGLWVLFAFVYGGDVRHHGFYFVLLLMGAWIGARSSSSSPSRDWRTKAATVTLAAVLVAHVAGTPVALYYDAKYVFSSGKRAADALKARGLADSLLVAEMDFPATAVIGQLGNDAMAYTPRTGRTFSFVKWTRDRRTDPTDEQTLAYAHRLGADKGRDVVLVMNRPLLPELVDGTHVVRLAELYDSMIEEENFYLYRLPLGAEDGLRSAR
jgi:hypothetical protein